MKTFITLAALMLSGSAAFAQDEGAKDHGLYLGAGVGQFSLKAGNIDEAGPVDTEFSEEDTSFKAFGGFRFGKFIAAELDYIDFGKPHENLGGVDVEAKIHGFAPYLVGILPIGEAFDVYAKAGYMFYDLNVDVGGEKVSSVSGNSEDFIGAVGFGVNLFEHLNVSMEYEYVDVSQASRAEAAWLTGAWRF
jgi:OOP family OmpA-OmpF porin